MDKKKKVVLISILILTAAVTSLILAALLISFAFRLPFSLTDGRVYLAWLVLIVAAGVAVLAGHTTRMGKRVLKVNKDLEDSHWLTWSEIKQNKGLTVTKLSKLGSVKDGVPVYAEKRKNDIKVVLAKTIHTLVIGTTGSGKTTTFVDPTVQILSRCKTKPCMVITDPKGEIFKHHAETLKEQGYTVNLIDLADAYHSTRWNPFNDVWKLTDRILCATDAKSVQWDCGQYDFDGRTFATYEEAERELKVFEQELTDEIFIQLQDLIYSACPIESKNDPVWQKGARDLIFSLALAMWEDVRDGYMTRKQFNLFNLSKTVADYCKSEESFDVLNEYFENRDAFSKTSFFGNTVRVSKDRTLTSYLGDVNSYLAWMADKGIAALTSGNEIEFDEFDERPNVLFLKIPDEKENRHKLIALFITQMYKALVNKAADNCKRGLVKEAELLRNVYFIMDEFGNMPKFHAIDKIITVGRSRKIFMLPIIQDFKQLENRYDKEVAAIIKSNCPIKIFIQAGDKETTEEFSALCGKHKVKRVSYSERNDVNVSTSVEEKPLIYPSELQKLNDSSGGRMGDAVVLANGKDPLRARFTPAFEAKGIYTMGDAKDAHREATVFDESDYYYDISKRSAFVKALSMIDEEADAYAENLLAELSANPEFDYDEEIAEEVKRIYIDLDRKLMTKLKDKLPADKYARLMKLDIMSRLGFLDELIDEAMNKKDRFLLFDLAFCKNYIRSSCLTESSEMGS